MWGCIVLFYTEKEYNKIIIFDRALLLIGMPPPNSDNTKKNSLIISVWSKEKVHSAESDQTLCWNILSFSWLDHKAPGSDT